MHIPDGYISPETAVVMYGAAAPFWYAASRKLKEVMTGQTVPLLAIFSAFSFTAMMFNIPVPGGTTAHAVGGTLAAIVLGPWAAVITVSVALVVQALFFGDGAHYCHWCELLQHGRGVAVRWLCRLQFPVDEFLAAVITATHRGGRGFLSRYQHRWLTRWFRARHPAPLLV